MSYDPGAARFAYEQGAKLYAQDKRVGFFDSQPQTKVIGKCSNCGQPVRYFPSNIMFKPVVYCVCDGFDMKPVWTESEAHEAPTQPPPGDPPSPEAKAPS